jgi:homocysteine S-methyltransferase
MTREEFKERLKRGPLLLDGATGTTLHDEGVPIDQCFDGVIRQNPDLVAAVHRGYIDAGADIIETNTFGANRHKLALHGLDNDVAGLNRASVSLARRVIERSSRPILLAGSVGPLGVRLAPLGRVKRAEAETAFAEQIAALVGDGVEQQAGRGVDLILLETISDLAEMEVAVSAARALAPDLPVISLITFTRDDRTMLDDTPADVAVHLARLGVDALGVNCSSGPVQVLRLISMFHEAVPDMPLAAMPNAGWPQRLDGGRVFYPATPEYFGRYARAFVEAGAQMIGGCCGTTSKHIAAMRRALDTPELPGQRIPRVYTRRADEFQAHADGPTQLKRALDRGQFITTVEMSPPRGISAERLLAGSRTLKEAGAGFVNVADNPLARMRMSAWAAAHLVQTKVGLESVLHFPTRGRNLLRIQGDLLAAHALGIRNLFVVMGDPTRVGDYPEATDNYDIVPTGLIRLIKRGLNSGVDQAGQRIDRPTSFTVGCALNLEPFDPDREIALLRKKIEYGADFALTQPVFDVAVARQFLATCKSEFGDSVIPVVAGIQPLYNSGNADFLHNEVPGIDIPDKMRQRMRAADNPQREGTIIALELLEELRPVVQGVYLIPAFGRYDLAAEVLHSLSGRQ